MQQTLPSASTLELGSLKQESSSQADVQRRLPGHASASLFSGK